MSRKLNRRAFIGQLGAATAATLAAGVVGVPSLTGTDGATAEAAEMGSLPMQRRQEAYQIRQQAALYQRTLPLLEHRSNGDDDRYATKIASYTKGLPHNDLGEVDLDVYRSLSNALASGQSAAFEALRLGNQMKLSNPLAAYAFELEGADPHEIECRMPPAFGSAETAGEMIELYWQALTRDVQFSAYDTHPLTNAAVTELSHLADFHGPKANGAVTPATLFRGVTPSDLVGPYLSQFLWLDIPVGTLTTVQRNRVTVSGDDYVTTYPEWLAIQRGVPPTRVNAFDPTPRYLHNGRGLAEYVHRDFTYQAYLHACLILLAMHAPFKTDHPYTHSLTQDSFVTFGAPHLLDLVARVANASLKAAWCHKWLVHRRLRPEEFAGRVHNHLTKQAQYPLHEEVLNANALSTVFRTYGSYLLPMAYPEGCPTHPAYPAGHAAIAGACTTVLKAFFNESFVIPNPMVAIPDGLALVPYKGADLTVGGELNKLASNIALARNTAGVHWRSDGIEGIKLGEAVAIGIFTDLKATCTEPFDGFSFTKFDGTMVRI